MIDLFSKIQEAIAKPENKYKYPYQRTADKKSYLHIHLIDAHEAAKEVLNLLKEEGLYDKGNNTEDI